MQPFCVALQIIKVAMQAIYVAMQFVAMKGVI